MTTKAKSKKLNKAPAHRNAIIKNMAISLVHYEVISTTKTKAKLVSSFFDRMMKRASAGDENAKRYIESITKDKVAIKKIFEVLVPRYKDRKSGLTSIKHLGIRVGDSSEMVQLSLVDGKKVVYVKRKETKPKKASKPATKAKPEPKKETKKDTKKTEQKTKTEQPSTEKKPEEKEKKSENLGDRLNRFLGRKDNNSQVKPEEE